MALTKLKRYLWEKIHKKEKKKQKTIRKKIIFDDKVSGETKLMKVKKIVANERE